MKRSLFAVALLGPLAGYVYVRVGEGYYLMPVYHLPPALVDVR
jgi:hypothetical protein